mmetsp:Transcript_382/g.1182  ORF Transcript_382/g.1182 Transcript_382/m.1182 type:complete len:224 (-) Transcript_382:1120-1791(-)
MLCSSSCSFLLASNSLLSCKTTLWMFFISQKIAVLPSEGSENLVKDTRNQVPLSSPSSSPSLSPTTKELLSVRHCPSSGRRCLFPRRILLLHTPPWVTATFHISWYSTEFPPNRARSLLTGLPSASKSEYMVFSLATMPKRVQLRGFCWSMMPHVVKIVRAVSVYLNTAWDLVTTSITSLEYFWWASCSYSSPKFTTPSVSTRRGDTCRISTEASAMTPALLP